MRALNQNDIQEKFTRLSALMNERCRRLWAATEARSLGYGGVSTVARATGMSRTTIQAALRELQDAGRNAEESKSKGRGYKTPKLANAARPSKLKPAGPEANTALPLRQRRAGAGRPPLIRSDQLLQADLEQMVAPDEGEMRPRPFYWTSKNVRLLARELDRQGHPVSHVKVAQLLRGMGYHLGSNRKAHAAESLAERHAQLEFLTGRVMAYQENAEPIIAVHARKQQAITPDGLAQGIFTAGGGQDDEREPLVDAVAPASGPPGHPPAGGTTCPGSAPPIAWTSVGKDYGTIEFLAAAIRRWWEARGRQAFPQARQLLILLEGGLSQGPRARCWKHQAHQLAAQTGLSLEVCYLPPAIYKWRQVQPEMACQFTLGWRAGERIRQEARIELIGPPGSPMPADQPVEPGRRPQVGRKFTEPEAQSYCEPSDFHGEWNYKIRPAAVVSSLRP